MKYISLNWTLALKFSIGKKKRMCDCRILMTHDCISEEDFEAVEVDKYSVPPELPDALKQQEMRTEVTFIYSHCATNHYLSSVSSFLIQASTFHAELHFKCIYKRAKLLMKVYFI